jgi:predicted DNA-binding WGR domain protein
VESETTAAGRETLPPEASNTNQDSVAESAAPPQAAAGHGTRRFEFTSGSSNKFWEITLAGTQHTVRFGRIGTKGQAVTKTFEDAAAARRDCERLIRSKRTKGYRETP